MVTNVGQRALDLEGLELPDPAEVANSTAFVNNMMVPVHRWYRYSAGFSAAWAEKLILESGAQRVLDPFAGSGTTVLSAEQAGVQSVGVDVHPFVSRVARAKLRWRDDPDELRARASRVAKLAKSYGSVTLPDSPLLQKCFNGESLAALVRLRDALEESRVGDGLDDILWLGLVSIVRVCSPVGTAQWQYVLPNKSKAKVAEPFSAFSQRIDIFAQDMLDRQVNVTGPGGTFLEEDARVLASVPDGWADLVVTSPPYANNYDYADVARLEMSLLGQVSGWGDLKPLRDVLMKSCSQQMGRWDPSEALTSPLLVTIAEELHDTYRKLETIRRIKPGNKAYHLMIVGYFYDSAKILQALRRACSPGSRVCYVVGDSAPYGIHVPVEEWLGRIAVSLGFESWTFDVARTRNEKWKNRKHRVPLKEGRLWIEG